MQHEGPRPDEIKSIFNSVAEGYDRANDAMTFGMARMWRRKVVAWSGAKTGGHVLDCATGTGDLAIEFKRVTGAKGIVIGTDFCEGMLEKAPAKAKRYDLDIEFKIADVMQLPFANDRFDIASIAYGIRNVSDPQKALSEMARVVKSGGSVMILETGDSPASGLKPVMDFYIRQVVPRVGGWITGHRSAYEYLNRSSRGFPSRDRFIEMMKSTGAFATCEYKVLFGGASFIYKGVVS
jgi:demethylmenaquinone methyltransferase/2-methoxy-6-polyprenyl-1,4-benzoquinol methylase